MTPLLSSRRAATARRGDPVAHEKAGVSDAKETKNKAGIRDAKEEAGTQRKGFMTRVP
jgi:hypothetical protein